MQSKLILDAGLVHIIGGSDYDFRYQKVGEKIGEDIERLMGEFELGFNELYSGHQVHGANVSYTDDSAEGFVVGKVFPDTDGLITDQAGVGLLVKFADCTPVLLFDPAKKVQAVVHSGWRSTVQRISQVAVDKMTKEFGSDLSDILAFVGPSIDQDNYEVGPEVYEAFSDFKTRDDFFKSSKNACKYQLDMKKANLAILLEAGIHLENIDVSALSTYTDERLHSARKEGSDYGLNAMISVFY